MDAREAKARQIVAGGRITRGEGCFLVPSQSGAGRHRVVLDGLFPCCTCADYELNEKTCKHMVAAALWREQQKTGVPQPAAQTEPSPRIPRKTYKQDWPNYNLAQNREKEHLQELL